MGVRFLSLNFDENGNSSMEHSAFFAIRPWIEGVEWIGEYSGSDSKLLAELVASFDLKAWIVQENLDVSGFSSDIHFIKDFSPLKENIHDLLEGDLHVNLSELDTQEKLDFLQSAFQKERLIFVSNQVDVSETELLSSSFSDLVFSLRSSEEDRPGWMDLGALQDYLEELDSKGLLMS
jgi:hypothetical protein